MIISKRKNRVAIYVDYENVKWWVGHTYSPEEIIHAIYNSPKDYEVISFIRIYVAMGLDNCEASISQKQVYKIYELGATLIAVPSFGGNGRVAIKNLADNALTCDLIADLFTHDEIDVFAIASGDKDFIPLVRKIREYGKKIKLFYNEKPSNHLIKEINLQADSEVINLGDLFGGMEIGSDEMPYRQVKKSGSTAPNQQPTTLKLPERIPHLNNKNFQ